MFEPWRQAWFVPVLIVTIGLPVLLIVFTELLRILERRESRAAGILRLIRNFVLPLGALLILISQIDNLALEVNWSRIVATVLGFVLILVVINMLNFALFATAETGSWRQRLPSIFIDIMKLVVIGVCFALLFQWVWGADVGGLFTALGVTSIVIGLALQNAAGSVVSGLLLLFEQPFKLGDWLDAGSVRGRVVQVNWRAVHIDTGNGTHIIPTATLAGSSFTNLSRVSQYFEATTTLHFAKTDAPSDVARLVRGIGRDLPLRIPETPIDVVPTGAGSFAVSIAVVRPADEGPTIAVLLDWLWFAARRAGLSLDGERGDASTTPERGIAAAERVAKRLRCDEEDTAEIERRGRLERFGTGETITRRGTTSTNLYFIIEGQVSLAAEDDLFAIPYHTLQAPESVGMGVYTQQPETDTARAVAVVTALAVPRDLVEGLITKHPRLAIELGQASDNRRQLLAAAIARREAAALAQRTGRGAN
ncbi:mechanosensitive ion channel domain-containing protein [Mycetocola saprophilus]|uniref:mechanosensitive ion channel domain-containing protein n=1 Tax=Mycetocola saprophilus TaxID=76636 RepID=UPI003BF07F10